MKTIYRERPEYEYVDPRIRRYISYCHCTPIVPTAEEGVFEYLAEQLADVFPNGRPDRIQCNRSSIVYKYTMPYHERFDMDDVPQDFAKSEVCKRYTSLLSMLNILYWYFETALIHRDLYTPLLRNCAQLLENGFVINALMCWSLHSGPLRTVLMQGYVSCVSQMISHSLTNIICIVMQLRHLYPIDTITVAGHINSLQKVLDSYANDIISFLSQRRKNALRMSAQFDMLTQHNHPSSQVEEEGKVNHEDAAPSANANVYRI